MTNSFRYNGENWNEYSLVEHLKNVCSNDEKYKNLYAVWTLDQETHSRALSAIYYNFPHYSMHDESHSLSIINKIEMLLGEDRIRSLSPTDTFLILESAYLHDIGMIVAQKELIEEWKKPTFERFLKDLKENSYDTDTVEAATYLLQMQKSENPFKENDWPVKVRHYVTIITSEYYRGKHSIRSANFIKDGANIGLNSNYNKLIPNRLIVLLQKIAISHGTNFEDSFNELEHFDNGIGTDTIHPRFIACLLRLGDLLDLDDGRFNEVFENVGYFPETSKIHKEKHRSITLFLVSPEKIQVSAVCKNTEIYRETRAWFDWLKEEVKNLSSRWSDIVPKGFKGGPPSLGNIKLSIEESENITEQLDLQFNIDQKRAFELIEGQGIYSDKLIFIRELIQNAMDATKIQMWKDIKNGKYDGMSEVLLGISEEKLKKIKYKKEFEFPSDLPEKINKYYPINISIDYDEKEDVLKFSIEDRGCGIGINDLKRMENVGGSWNQDKKSIEFIDDMPEFLQPTGNFGLGLHSVFLATDELEISTKSEDDKAYDITFVSRKKNGYITVKENNNKKIIGSKISLKIRGKEKIEECIESTTLFLGGVNHVDIFDENFESKIICNKIKNYTGKFIQNIKLFDIYINNTLALNNEYDFLAIETEIYSNSKIYNIDKYATFKKISEKIMNIEIKDKKEGIIVVVENRDSTFNNNSINFNFKGIKCKIEIANNKKYSWEDNIFSYDIEIYKGEAKSIVGVSRDYINKNKYLSIKKRIEEELMPKVVDILGEEVKTLSLDENDKESNRKIAKFLFAYMQYKGHSLVLKKDLSNQIIMGKAETILENNEISTVSINYSELVEMNEAIYYTMTKINIFKNSDKILERYKNTYLFNPFKRNYFSKLIIKYVLKNFKVCNIFKPEIDGVILEMSKNNIDNTTEFLTYEHRYNYIKSLLNKNTRHRMNLVNSICGFDKNIYKILIVNKSPYRLRNIFSYGYPFFYEYYQDYNFIITPFYSMPKGYLEEKDIDYIIEFLKRERYFNELIDWVAEYSLEKDKHNSEELKILIENAYKELIQECIEVAKKEKELAEKENDEQQFSEYNDLQMDELAYGSEPEEVK